MIRLVLKMRDYFSSVPYFCAKFYHGSKKKFKRFILDTILYFCCSFSTCHCNALALVNADTAFCYYFLCVGDGHYLRTSNFHYKEMPALLPVFLLRPKVFFAKNKDCFFRTSLLLTKNLHFNITEITDKTLGFLLPLFQFNR